MHWHAASSSLKSHFWWQCQQRRHYDRKRLQFHAPNLFRRPPIAIERISIHGTCFQVCSNRNIESVNYLFPIRFVAMQQKFALNLFTSLCVKMSNYYVFISIHTFVSFFATLQYFSGGNVLSHKIILGRGHAQFLWAHGRWLSQSWKWNVSKVKISKVCVNRVLRFPFQNKVAVNESRKFSIYR